MPFAYAPGVKRKSPIIGDAAPVGAAAAGAFFFGAAFFFAAAFFFFTMQTRTQLPFRIAWWQRFAGFAFFFAAFFFAVAALAVDVEPDEKNAVLPMALVASAPMRTPRTRYFMDDRFIVRSAVGCVGALSAP